MLADAFMLCRSCHAHVKDGMLFIASGAPDLQAGIPIRLSCSAGLQSCSTGYWSACAALA